MRRAGRIDGNQTLIVRALREAGASVLILSDMGQGVPDLLVAKAQRTFLLELKDSAQKPSARRLTDDERCFHALWRGEIYVVETPEEALARLG